MEAGAEVVVGKLERQTVHESKIAAEERGDDSSSGAWNGLLLGYVVGVRGVVAHADRYKDV